MVGEVVVMVDDAEVDPDLMGVDVVTAVDGDAGTVGDSVGTMGVGGCLMTVIVRCVGKSPTLEKLSDMKL